MDIFIILSLAVYFLIMHPFSSVIGKLYQITVRTTRHLQQYPTVESFDTLIVQYVRDSARGKPVEFSTVVSRLSPRPPFEAVHTTRKTH